MIIQYEILEQETGRVFVAHRCVCLSHAPKFIVSEPDSVTEGTGNNYSQIRDEIYHIISIQIIIKIFVGMTWCILYRLPAYLRICFSPISVSLSTLPVTFRSIIN